MVNSLSRVTDDPRVAISSDEYDRIAIAKKYYADDFDYIHYRNTYGQECKRVLSSINVTKLAARRLASIIFNEQCKVVIDDDSAQALFDDIAKDESFYTTLEEYLEKWIALGSGAIRPYVQDDKIKLAWIIADQFYPLESNTNEVNNACISSQTVKSENGKQVYYTLLEFHQWQDDGTYSITNELYRSESPDIIGDNVPLNTLSEYADLLPQVNLLGLKEPLFAFFKTPGANNQSIESPLGLGLVDNSKNTVDAINRTHDQFVWDVKMGKRRVAVPAEMLGSVRTMQGQDEMHPKMFDSEQDVYEAMYGDTDQLKITDLTTEIRTQQYQDAMNFFLSEFENEVGLSQGTFTNTPNGLQTATEVVSNNSMTYQTRSSYLTQVEKMIQSLVVSILEVAQAGQLFSSGQSQWSGDPSKVAVRVDFNDGVFVDRNAQAQQDMQAMTNKVMPRIEFLKRNYDLDDETAQKWLDQVDNETEMPAPLAESGVFGGGEDNGAANNDNGGDATTSGTDD
ncbi:phage portal protein [Ligilactobacillus acidipiscis]|uniref:phage portal protein n=1 Tax=Ligilactobacillus acidipiscis TaxID=89059 RepID=UPI0023F88E5B|nr:phage portal protein [Ligilactobacillus acidipiscis]WEV56140.1 phage portal protein [Ligilactobacillus acidipiscis]